MQPVCFLWYIDYIMFFLFCMCSRQSILNHVSSSVHVGRKKLMKILHGPWHWGNKMSSSIGTGTNNFIISTPKMCYSLVFCAITNKHNYVWRSTRVFNLCKIQCRQQKIKSVLFGQSFVSRLSSLGHFTHIY